MDSLFDYEKNKYNYIHNYTGIDSNQLGYGRQIRELLNNENNFHKKWRELLNEKKSFLEVGLGAGEIIKFLHNKNINYYGIDISDYIVNELKNKGYNTKHCSAHNIDFENNSFDVVQHLDGMEHIPVEWEYEVLSEEVRVSKQYIFYSNAMGDAYLDQISKSRGYNELHINIKNENEWLNFYEKNSIKLNYKIDFYEVLNETFYIILLKNK